MTGKFVHFDLTTLQTMRTNLLAAHAAALKAQEYEVSGGDTDRRKKMVDLNQISADLGEVGYAISMKSGGGGQRFTYADMSNPTG